MKLLTARRSVNAHLWGLIPMTTYLQKVSWRCPRLFSHMFR